MVPLVIFIRDFPKSPSPLNDSNERLRESVSEMCAKRPFHGTLEKPLERFSRALTCSGPLMEGLFAEINRHLVYWHGGVRARG